MLALGFVAAMIAGNVGAGRRVTYTIVGDAVNQAAVSEKPGAAMPRFS
jgi:predicted regulator of Ras-like GTPase activity (Roadblock/LC7/MglB family)